MRGCGCGTPCYLQEYGEVGHAGRHGYHVVAVGAAHGGHFSRETELHVVVGERHFVADHGGEVEVVGVGAAEVDRVRTGQQVAERGHVAAQREAEHRHVGRAQTGHVAVLASAAEVAVDEYDHATQGTRVGDRLQEDARGGGVHHQLLAVGVVRRHGDVGRYEVDVIHDAFEVVTRTHVDVSAQCQRELVVLGREDELRLLHLLETRTVRFAVVEDRCFGGQTVQFGSLLCGAGAVGAHVRLVHGDQVDGGRVFVLVTESPVALSRSGGDGEQSQS